MRLLLDTHALIWWQAKSKKLSRTARVEMKRADTLLVSAVSCWEVATLVAHGRIALDRSLDDWLSDMDADPQIELLDLSPRAAVQTHVLHGAGFHGDPADRLIYAAAAELLVPLVTADERMHAFAKTAHPSVRIIW